MKNKTLAWQILSLAAVLTGIYGGFAGETGQKIFGLISFAVTAVLQSKILSSGQWPKGWTEAMWATQIVGIIIQIANFLTDHYYVDPHITNVVVMTINAFLATFVKDYGSGSVATDLHPGQPKS